MIFRCRRRTPATAWRRPSSRASPPTTTSRPLRTGQSAAASVIPGDNIILRGDGKGATIIKPISGATLVAVSTPILGSSGTAGYAHYYIGVESLEIDCSNMTSNVAGAGNGIHWYGIRWSHIRDVYVNAAKN